MATLPAEPAAGRRDAAPALAALVRDCVEAGVERDVLHLAVSRLAPQLARSHHRRLLLETLDPALHLARGRLFELGNGDLVAVAPGGAAHLDRAQRSLTTLLAGLAAADDPPFVRLRLPRQAAALLSVIEAAVMPPSRAVATPGAAFGPGDLAAIERALAGASLSAHLHRRPVCRLGPDDDGPVLAWEEAWIDLPAVCAALCPGLDIGTAPWLARRLRGVLQRGLLHELAQPAERRSATALGLCLSAGLVTEPEFLALDAALGPAARARTVIALDVPTLLEDARGWRFAADFLRMRGFQVAVEVTEPGVLGWLHPAGLGIERVRLRWVPGQAIAMPATIRPDQVVLAGADAAAAIGCGWDAGITLFTGRLIRPA